MDGETFEEWLKANPTLELFDRAALKAAHDAGVLWASVKLASAVADAERKLAAAVARAETAEKELAELKSLKHGHYEPIEKVILDQSKLLIEELTAQRNTAAVRLAEAVGVITRRHKFGCACEWCIMLPVINPSPGADGRDKGEGGT